MLVRWAVLDEIRLARCMTENPSEADMGRKLVVPKLVAAARAIALDMWTARFPSSFLGIEIIGMSAVRLKNEKRARKRESGKASKG
jgi:hypothetical protein